MCLYVIALKGRLFYTGNAENIGLIMPQKIHGRSLLEVLPVFLMLPVYNFWSGGHRWPFVETVLFCVCVSMAEEIFFRGVLLRFFLRWTPLAAILLSSALFALSHGGNLLQGVSLIYVLTQMVCAFGAGICYAVLALRHRSLLLGIAVHSLTNITGIGVGTNRTQLLPLWFIAAGYVGYGLFLYRRMQNPDARGKRK